MIKERKRINEPKTKNCYICNQPLRFTSHEALEYVKQKSGSYVYFHTECLDKISKR